MQSVSKIILLILSVASIHAFADADTICPSPDEVVMNDLDKQGNERVDVIWNGHKYHKTVKGRAREPNNEAEITEWILELEEMECSPTRS